MSDTRAPRPPRRKAAPLLPREDARDGALVFVVATLCFLACLAAVFTIGADRAARGWRTELTGSATVVVRPKADETADAAAARAAEVLAGVRGVDEADALEREKADALLRPWLGDDDVLKDLPVPRLVSVDLDPKAPASAADMDQALKAARIDATCCGKIEAISCLPASVREMVMKRRSAASRCRQTRPRFSRLSITMVMLPVLFSIFRARSRWQSAPPCSSASSTPNWLTLRPAAVKVRPVRALTASDARTSLI